MLPQYGVIYPDTVPVTGGEKARGKVKEDLRDEQGTDYAEPCIQ